MAPENRSTVIAVALIIVIVAALTTMQLLQFYLFPAVNSGPPNISEHSFAFNQTIAFDHIEAQVNIGYRYPGSVEINLTRDYIVDILHSFKWRVFSHSFIHLGVNITNILGFPAYSTNQTLDSTLLFGAHYATRIHAA